MPPNRQTGILHGDADYEWREPPVLSPEISLPSTFFLPSSRTSLFPTAAPAPGDLRFPLLDKEMFFCGSDFAPASIIAAMIFRYPVQRQSTPPMASITSLTLGVRFFSSNAVAAISIPGVQAPH